MKSTLENQLEIAGRRGSFSGLRSVNLYFRHCIDSLNFIHFTPFMKWPVTIRRAGTPTQEALCV